MTLRLAYPCKSRVRAIETRTRDQSDFARVRMIRGDASAVAVYDTGSTPVHGGVVLVLHHDDKPILELELEHGASGAHEATCSPLPLRRGVNVLRLVTSVYGGPAPTRASLRIITEDGVVLDSTFETSDAVSSIDQSWKIVRA